MISGIQSLWVALSTDATPVCCEGDYRGGNVTADMMPLGLFRGIAEIIVQEHLACRVLTNQQALPDAYVDICRQIGAEIIVPNTYEGAQIDTVATVVVDQQFGDALSEKLRPERVILRARQSSLGDLTRHLQILLARVPNISIKHPDLLLYTDEDFHLYQEQLEELGRWLVTRGPEWTSLQVDCLTVGLIKNSIGECDAGNRYLAIGPNGQTYLCPGFLHSGQTLGMFLEEVIIPGRHLLTRSYAPICKECSVDYCLRCIFHNKISTREYGVSATNVCKLAHMEQRARAALAQNAKQCGCWNADWTEPVAPEILDPFETLDAKDVLPLWQDPTLAAGRTGEIGSGTMLEIINEIQGIVHAAHLCVQSGSEIDTDYLLANTPLVRARARTIEAYRDVRFAPDCPTIREIEQSVLKAVRGKRS